MKFSIVHKLNRAGQLLNRQVLRDKERARSRLQFGLIASTRELFNDEIVPRREEDIAAGAYLAPEEQKALE